MAEPLAIMGGAFDPIHNGHLRTAIELREALGLDEVRFVPSANPPHRPPHVAAADQRLGMLEAAIADLDGCSVDTRELDRPGPSWSVVTLEELRAELGQRSLSMIVGMDAFAGLDGWHRWHELLNLAHIIVACRPGASLPDGGELGQWLEKHRTLDPAAISGKPGGHVYIHDVTLLEISSSSIRERIRRHQSIRYLVPDSVARLISDSGLYSSHADATAKEQKLHAQ